MKIWPGLECPVEGWVYIDCESTDEWRSLVLLDAASPHLGSVGFPIIDGDPKAVPMVPIEWARDMGLIPSVTYSGHDMVKESK